MTLIIAEAGVNHNGSKELAFKLVETAFYAGADIVKFQTFKAGSLVTSSAKQAEYQVANTLKEESQLSMLGRLELSYEAHYELLKHCKDLGIEFLSTAFDSESLEFLVEGLGLKKLKISSGELTNAPLVLEHAKTGLEIIVSTGMASLSEIESALSVIAFGYLCPNDTAPSMEKFSLAYSSSEGQAALREKVTILHCTTEYPAPFDEINLRSIDGILNAFGLKVGYSDHSAGIAVPIAAVARGACVVEKHFTLDKNMEGPDHKASLNPQELKLMVQGIRETEMALGSQVKIPTLSEVKNKLAARKSIVAAKDVELGETFSRHNLAVMRPGSGMSPYDFWALQAKKATKSYKLGELIDE